PGKHPKPVPPPAISAASSAAAKRKIDDDCFPPARPALPRLDRGDVTPPHAFQFRIVPAEMLLQGVLCVLTLFDGVKPADERLSVAGYERLNQCAADRVVLKLPLHRFAGKHRLKRWRSSRHHPRLTVVAHY